MYLDSGRVHRDCSGAGVDVIGVSRKGNSSFALPSFLEATIPSGPGYGAVWKRDILGNIRRHYDSELVVYSGGSQIDRPGKGPDGPSERRN
mgnify:CR=1 FL=1